MIERQQVNLRLERDLVDLLDDLARSEHVDRTEVARRILVEGVAKARMDRALREYAAGHVTSWKAASDAGVSLYEMQDRIHEARIPYELDPDDLARITGHASKAPAGDPVARASRVAEQPAGYAPDLAKGDAQSGIAELRDHYRPSDVRILFVGESSPAQGTHFYRANSNLHQATRAAFADALGEDVVPAGEAFLRFFRDRGCWLVDIADGPVNRLPDAERRRAVDQGSDQLAHTIRETAPERIVAVKRDIEGPVRRAMAQAGAGDVSLLVLPFPVRQWRPTYVEGLARLLHGEAPVQVDRPRAIRDRSGASGPRARETTDARQFLRSLIGRELHTITQRKVNRVLAIERGRFLVATDESPEGAWEAVSRIQEALDRLTSAGELEVTKDSLGHWRTALVGAILAEVPGVEVASTSPRRLVINRVPRP